MNKVSLQSFDESESGLLEFAQSENSAVHSLLSAALQR